MMMSSLSGLDSSRGDEQPEQRDPSFALQVRVRKIFVVCCASRSGLTGSGSAASPLCAASGTLPWVFTHVGCLSEAVS